MIRAAVVFTESSALELRAFAAARSGGLWDELRPEIIEEIAAAGGEYENRQGPWGTELLAKVPITTEEGHDAVQPSRIIGIEGPRWFLRATVLGQQALEPTEEGLLMDTLRDVVVRRGDEARMVREQLNIVVPDGVESTDDSTQ